MAREEHLNLLLESPSCSSISFQLLNLLLALLPAPQSPYCSSISFLLLNPILVCFYVLLSELNEIFFLLSFLLLADLGYVELDPRLVVVVRVEVLDVRVVDHLQQGGGLDGQGYCRSDGSQCH